MKILMKAIGLGELIIALIAFGFALSGHPFWWLLVVFGVSAGAKGIQMLFWGGQNDSQGS